jgi:hypothetical protein
LYFSALHKTAEYAPKRVPKITPFYARSVILCRGVEKGPKTARKMGLISDLIFRVRNCEDGALKKAQSVTMTNDEAGSYQALVSWAMRDGALRFVFAVINTRPVVAGPDPQKWFVPSSSRAGEFHTVDIDLRVCDCAGWMFKRHCSHLAIADRAARLRFELLTATPAMPVGQTERPQAQAMR